MRPGVVEFISVTCRLAGGRGLHRKANDSRPGGTAAKVRKAVHPVEHHASPAVGNITHQWHVVDIQAVDYVLEVCR